MVNHSFGPVAKPSPCLILVPRWLSTLLRILDSGVRTWIARRYPMKNPDWNWRIHFIFSTCYRCTKLTSLRIGGCWMAGCLLVVHVFPTPTSRVVREAYIHKGDQIWGFGGRVLRRYLPRAGGVRLVATHQLGVCLSVLHYGELMLVAGCCCSLAYNTPGAWRDTRLFAFVAFSKKPNTFVRRWSWPARVLAGAAYSCT